MCEIKNWERVGVSDFLSAQPSLELATTLAKIVSKKILTPQDLAGECADDHMISFCV